MNERKGRPRGASIAPTDNDWRVLHYLLRLILKDVQERGGWARIHYSEMVGCFCSLVSLAAELNMSEAAVRKAVRRLNARRMLYRERCGCLPSYYYMRAGAARVLIDALNLFAPLCEPWPTRKTAD